MNVYTIIDVKLLNMPSLVHCCNALETECRRRLGTRIFLVGCPSYIQSNIYPRFNFFESYTPSQANNQLSRRKEVKGLGKTHIPYIAHLHIPFMIIDSLPPRRTQTPHPIVLLAFHLDVVFGNGRSGPKVDLGVFAAREEDVMLSFGECEFIWT